MTRPNSKGPPPIINELIKAPEVRVIAQSEDEDEHGEVMLGIFPIEEALEMAKQKEQDLVLINENADPPVCKIIDYGKHKYVLEKKKKDNQKRQVRSDIKEVKMSVKIDDHDFDVRLRAALRFLEEGDRVKAIVQFKGREMQYTALGQEVLLRMLDKMQTAVVVESPPKLEGRSMMMILGPKKGK
ncbi:translation initiation factor IF-3 [archaeon]|nr:MAG: translation initiation factor IF-3 [archaeon]